MPQSTSAPLEPAVKLDIGANGGKARYIQDPDTSTIVFQCGPLRSGNVIDQLPAKPLCAIAPTIPHAARRGHRLAASPASPEYRRVTRSQRPDAAGGARAEPRRGQESHQSKPPRDEEAVLDRRRRGRDCDRPASRRRVHCRPGHTEIALIRAHGHAGVGCRAAKSVIRVSASTGSQSVSEPIAPSPGSTRKIALGTVILLCAADSSREIFRDSEPL